jgi:hypothetical protein
VSLPAVRTRPPSASTAETLVLVALILQVLAAVFLGVGLLWLVGLTIFLPFPFAWVAVIVLGSVVLVAGLFLYLAYEFSYQRIRRGDYQAAQSPTLILGIISLFFGILPGVLYLVGYAKLGDAVREQQGFTWGGYPAPGYAAPAYPVPPPLSSIACTRCGRVWPMGQFAYCPSCGQKFGP